MKKLSGLFVLDTETLNLVYGPGVRRDIDRFVNWVAEPQTRDTITDNLHLLKDVEVIFSGWTPPTFDDEFLDRSPNLKAIFFAGGPIPAHACHRRGIAVTVAHHANSIPVAEYTFASIIFALKHAWGLAREASQTKTHVSRNGVPGCYRRVVGLAGLGMTSRILLRLIKQVDVEVIVHDPFLSEEESIKLGVELVSLEEMFRRSDVVSMHVPANDATREMIRGKHFAMMKPGAAFINTARGSVVKESEMLNVASERKDLQFVIDVSNPEPPESDSLLYTLPNVFYTPHIAGSAGGECARLGRYMVDELNRFVAGQPLKWAIVPATQPSLSVTINRAHLGRENDTASSPLKS